jgi:hypothetical protein
MRDAVAEEVELPSTASMRRLVPASGIWVRTDQTRIWAQTEM